MAQRKPTFGVLVGQVNTGYYKNILSGILDFVKEKDFSLFSFASGLINSSLHWESDKNILFSMVDEMNVTGLIVTTTALEKYIGREALPSFFAQFQSFPLASIGTEVRGVPSFLTDNETGLLELLAHLTNHHPYRRLAYISGPLANSEAAVRFAVYRNFLQSRGLPFDPDLVFEGGFTGQSGKRAVRTLLRERKTKVDVIVAGNDIMAMGAIEELRGMGLQVPGDMFVVGFDDIETSVNANLTTVRQPLYEQGYESAAVLYRALRREPCPLTTRLPTTAVFRGSCGCPSSALRSCPIGNTPVVPAPAAATPAADRERALAEMTEEWGGASPRRSAALLYDAFLRSRETRSAEAFLGIWKKTLFETAVDKRFVPFFQKAVSCLRTAARRRPLSPEDSSFIEDILHHARILAEEELRREEAAQSIAAEIQEEHLTAIDQSLTGPGGLDERLNIIYTEFPALGIRSCYLSLYEDPEDPLRRAKLILAYDDFQKIDLPAGGVSFPTRELIPAAVYPAGWRHNFVVKSLAHGEKNLGFILMELGDNVQFAGIFDYLCPKLSSVLQLAIFIDKMVGQAQDLDRANKELAESNQALEEFAFMASHELQEPLRKILIFGERLTGSGNHALNGEGRDFLTRMQHAAMRMKKMIESILAYSRIASAAMPFTVVDLQQTVNKVLSEMADQIERSGARLEIAPLPVVSADPELMIQLFQNLIVNAIKFQPPGGRPAVKIFRLTPEAPGQVALVVEDNGIGIAQKDYQNIFVIFHRLNSHQEYEGSGIGLAICKRIMEQHGGSITVESAPGVGTKFILRFGLKTATPTPI